MKAGKRGRRGWMILLIGLLCMLAYGWMKLPEMRYKPIVDFSSEQSAATREIVERARELEQVEWTPLADIRGWKEHMIYKASHTYRGLPYGQPIDAGYVPWDADLNTFLAAVQDPSSLMYADQASAIAIAPYYSIDCSAFVSWAWGLPSRQTTWTIPEFADLISEDNYANAQIGDAINGPNHVVLITEIERDKEGTIIAMEITESSPKSLFNSDGTIQTTRYGRGSLHSLQEIQLKYFDRGYSLYRKRNRDGF